MARDVTGLIHALEPAMPVFEVQTMTAALAGSLGALGLALAAIGVYGVVSYAASQRTHEISIRMALGAQPGQILRMIFGRGCIIVVLGIITGVLAAAAMAKLVGSLLAGVAPVDPLTYAGASFLLALDALAASYIPARRATKVDPLAALRYE
jgi:putative ABC transport system permease protein